MAGPLRPYPPLPPKLNGRPIFFSPVPKVEKNIFSLMALPFPPPLLMARPLREEIFFPASLTIYLYSYLTICL